MATEATPRTMNVAGNDRPRRRKVLRPPSFSPASMGSHIVNLFDYGDLMYTLSNLRIKVRYKQSALGWLWAVLQPLALMLIYTVIFSLIARMPSEGAPYSVSTYTALLPWLLFTTGVTTATLGMVSNSELVRKVYFPREILPLTYIVAAIFDFLIACIVLAAMMIHFHVRITSNLLYAIPVMLVCIVFTTSVALFLSATQVRVRDFGLALPLLFQVWIFACPIVYPLSLVPARLRGWYLLNPMVGIVDNFRRVVLQGLPLDVATLKTSAIVAVVLLPFCYAYFKKIEATMADVI